jgi:hypothetical protein
MISHPQTSNRLKQLARHIQKPQQILWDKECKTLKAVRKKALLIYQMELSMKALGLVTKEMASVSKFGLIVLAMKENGETIRPTAEENSSTLMEMSTMVTG